MKRLFYAERRAARSLRRNGGLLIRAEARYPEFTAEFPLIQASNAEYARRAQTAVRAFVDEHREEAEGALLMPGAEVPFEFVQTFSITLPGGRIVSLYFDAYRSTAGARGSAVRAGDTFIPATGERLPLAALFPRGAPYVDRILERVSSAIETRRAEEPAAYYENSAELAAEAFHPANYYLSPGTLHVFYQQYDIAPYLTGIPTFSMSLCAVGAGIPK